MQNLQAGQHIITFVADDCIRLTLNGVIEPQDVATICDAELACAKKNGYVLVAVDATHVTGLPAASRRFASQQLPRIKDIYGVAAVFGTSATTRVLFGMVIGALRILSANKSKLTTHFFKTEAEALRCLDEARATFRSELR